MDVGSLGWCDGMFEKQKDLLQGALYETGGGPHFSFWVLPDGKSSTKDIFIFH